jgi:hypothetical protein
VIAALAFLTLAGCMNPSINDSARIGPFHAPLNHTGDPELPATLRRVVLLPIAGGSIAPAESVAALDPVFVAELQKQNRFEVVTISRAECLRRFRSEEFLSTSALPHDFAGMLHRFYGADGVMFVDLTVFKPYRPLIIGVRAKLVTVDYDVRIVWAFDNVFSANDARVANSARNHYIDSDRRDIPADFTQAALQSPSRFAGYVAAEMFETLPPVHNAHPAVKK